MDTATLFCRKGVEILIDDACGVKTSLSIGDEIICYPTNDGMKFMLCGKEFSPYDFKEYLSIERK